MRLRIYFEPRDIWIGVYWKHTVDLNESYRRVGVRTHTLHLYICLLPMFPVHIMWAH